MLKISIIIPIYNMEQYLKECLDSVISQTIDEKEIICIDDGSTDRSVEIVLKYKEAFPNLRLYRQKRKGAGAARNLGICEAGGEYIAFMDADDYYPDENALIRLYTGAKEHGVGSAGGRLIALRENVLVGAGKGISKVDETAFEREEVIDYQDYQGFVGYQAFIYRREMLIENGILFPNYTRFQDPSFMIRALDAAGKIWTTDKNSYVFRHVDKTLDLSSANVIEGFMEGFYELAAFSRRKGYEKALDYVLKMMNNYRNHFLVHIAEGNDRLLGMLRSIDLFYAGKEKNDNYYLHMTRDEIVGSVCKYKQEICHLFDTMKSYPGVVIYGAGRHARMLYNAIKNESEIAFRGFAVSDDCPQGTAGGIEIRSIKDYRDHAGEYLIVIAVQERYFPEMEKTAKDLGYENIIYAGENVINPSEFVINDSRFAV